MSPEGRCFAEFSGSVPKNGRSSANNEKTGIFVEKQRKAIGRGTNGPGREGQCRFFASLLTGGANDGCSWGEEEILA
jgi:hypothetical protein